MCIHLHQSDNVARLCRSERQGDPLGKHLDDLGRLRPSAQLLCNALDLDCTALHRT
jgi:hypothetical protein